MMRINYWREDLTSLWDITIRDKPVCLSCYSADIILDKDVKRLIISGILPNALQLYERTHKPLDFDILHYDCNKQIGKYGTEASKIIVKLRNCILKKVWIPRLVSCDPKYADYISIRFEFNCDIELLDKEYS